jgi:hypothetical protein
MFPGIEAAPKSSLIEGIALAFPSPPPSGGGAIPVDEPVSYLSYPPLAAPSSAKLHKKKLKKPYPCSRHSFSFSVQAQSYQTNPCFSKTQNLEVTGIQTGRF